MTKEQVFNAFKEKGIEVTVYETPFSIVGKVIIDTTEHDKRIRAEVVEEIKGIAQHYLIGAMDLENATKYGNKNAKQQDISYGTLMRYEIANCVDDFIDGVERLKEQK